MLKDFNFKLKGFFSFILILMGASFGIYYIGAHSDKFDAILKNFSINAEEVQGIVAFSIIFFLIVRLVSNSLVRPFVNLNEKREDATVNKIKKANELLEEASILEDEFYKKANEEKRHALTQKAIILTDARRKAEDVIFQTENEISAQVASAKERIDLRSKIMLNELVLKKQEFVDMIKDKVINL